MSAESMRARVEEFLRTIGEDDRSQDRFADALVSRLEALLEWRAVLPSQAYVVDLGRSEVIPVSETYWLALAWIDLEQIGLLYETCHMLRRRNIIGVGTLLLHSAEDLQALAPDDPLSDEAMNDIADCLEHACVRLPTSEEVAAAKAAGFWHQLSDQSYHVGTMRIAACELPYMDTERFGAACGVSAQFFSWARLDHIADVLRLAPAELTARLRDFFVRTDGSALTDAAAQAEVDEAANRIVSWLAAADLTLASA